MSSERRIGWIAVAMCMACHEQAWTDSEATAASAGTSTATEGTSAGTSGAATSQSTTEPQPTSGGPTSGETTEQPTSGGPTSETTNPGTTSETTNPGTTSETTTGPGTTSETTTGPGTTSETTTGPGTTGETTGGQACGTPEEHDGQATYYAADGSGNCSFDANPNDPMVAAMNTPDYMASAVCGACVQIDGPDGQIVVKIVDRCPECQKGHIDLSEGAFPMIADKNLGIVPITWRYVPCDVDGPIVYHFKEGSNQWWTAVQIRNHRFAIATFEFKDDNDQWQSVPRLDYNYFVADQGMGPGPYEFRVTDVEGNVLEDSGIPFKEAGDSPGASQFPACMP